MDPRGDRGRIVANASKLVHEFEFDELSGGAAGTSDAKAYAGLIPGGGDKV